ncbi:hypothetical protein MMC25_005558 [Agyrium rufum]|nr:hypothetical protein [Agyrium rufum]
MGASQSIPVIGEVITVSDGLSRTIATGACAITGQSDAAKKMIDSPGETFVSYSERSPIAGGHVVGIANYAQGDTEAGTRCMIKASRTTALIAATVATDGGSLVVGGAVVGAGLAYDAAASIGKSAVTGEFRPVGLIGAQPTS